MAEKKKNLRKGKAKTTELSEVETKKKKKTKTPKVKGEKKSSKSKKSKAVDKKKLSKIQYNSDDYLIVKEGAKYQFGTALGQNKLLLEKGVENDETAKTIDFEPEDVVANMGATIIPGTSAFGITMTPYEFSMEDKKWGTIHFYRKITDDREMKYFKAMLTKIHEKLAEIKATGFMPLTLKILPQKGKKAGWYNYNTKNGDTLALLPIDFRDKEYNDYVLFHEAAHGIWFRQIPRDIQVKWIDIYEERINVHSADKKKLQRLAKEAAGCAEGIGSFIKNECEGEDIDIMKECIAYVKRVHKITQKQLELYIEQNGTKSILKFWPTSTDIGKPLPDVSEYAMESYEELFAESFAFYMTGRKLPKDVKKLLKSTIKALVKDYD